jgi:hypothetical protein
MGYLYALAVSPGLLRICASNIGPAELFHRNGAPRDGSPYTRAFAAQLEACGGAPCPLALAVRVEHGNVEIEALEHDALARFAATPTTKILELFEATARCMGLPVPVQEFGVDDWDRRDYDDCHQSPNPYFDDANWPQRYADREDAARRQAD